MDRSIVYPASIPQDTDILNSNKQPMIALGRLCAALFGTGGIVSGLAVSPTSPASLSVNVGAGEIYQLENVDNTPYGSLAADTTDQIVKQGILLQSKAPVVLACPAPTTTGFSINYLIEATYADADINSTVLPYYNAANPSQPYAGPGNSGQSQATTRSGTVSLQPKAGIAATTGTQTTPAADAGYIALAVVTVAYGQATITSGNIVAVTSGVLPASLLAMIQNGDSNYAVDTGAANAYAAAYSPSITAVTDGLKLRFKAAHANTGAVTFAPNGITAAPVIGGAHAALQGGEIVANGDIEVVWNSTLASWVLLEQTGGSSQVAPAAQSNQAVNLGQFVNSFGGAGYAKLPGGLIMQWGGASFSTAGAANTFPVAFPNACLSLAAGNSGTSGLTVLMSYTAVSSTGFTAKSSSGAGSYYYMALGY